MGAGDLFEHISAARPQLSSAAHIVSINNGSILIITSVPVTFIFSFFIVIGGFSVMID